MSEIFTYTLTDDDYPCTLVLFDKRVGGVEAVQFGDQTRSPDEYQYDDPPEWFAPSFKGGIVFAKARWVQTDGWRGHSDWDLSPGWVNTATGWVTGYPDDTVAHKLEASEVYERMFVTPPPFPVVWVFGPTSNVFSTVSDTFVREGDEHLWTEYLISLGSDEDTFRDAFR